MNIKRVVIFTICCVLVLSVLYIAKSNKPPRPLGTERANDYEKILVFFSEHKDWGDLIIRNVGTGSVDITTNKIPPPQKQKIGNKHFQNLEVLLDKTSTMSVSRKHDLIIFKLEPEYFLVFFLLRKPGYVYSPTGNDPRKTYDYMLNISRPFYPIGNNWYYTNNLRLG